MWIIEQDDFIAFNQEHTSWVKPNSYPRSSKVGKFESEVMKKKDSKTVLSTSIRNFQSFPIKGFLFEKKKNYFLFVSPSQD